MVNYFILFFSALFQFSAAFYALYLIRITKSKITWILVSTALMIMGIRRLLPFLDLIRGHNECDSVLYNLIGLIISMCMMGGMIGIRYIFLEQIESAENIKKLLAEKQIILKEVHHRIKNNMYSLSFMLKLHSLELKDRQSVAIIQDVQSRIQTMMTLYDKLYRSDNQGEISIKDYFSTLVSEIISIFPITYKLNVKQEIQDFKIDKKILFPLGIIINELITNSIKYAFSGKNEGNIFIKADKDDDQITIMVKDDGIGIKNEDEDKNGFGLMLIKELTRQINGEYMILKDDGLSYKISFNQP